MASVSENSRRIERERVLSLLYEAEMKSQSVDEVLASLPLAPDEFVVDTLRGVAKDIPSLDELIDHYAIGWEIDRMASLDKNVLRIASYELRDRPDLPIAVIISEAVELAKRFSTDESGKFVNGILSSMAGDVRDEEAPAP